jgi:uroporphyrinogen decarboxylase
VTLANATFLDACRGLKPARTPLWIMRQAGRYLPEYREVRSRVSFEELCRTPALCAEVTLQPIHRFELDAAILFSDILVVLDAFGVDVTFNPGPTIANAVRSDADLHLLQELDPATSLSYVYDAVRACKHALQQRVPLIGFCGAPWTVASYLVEGNSTTEFARVKRWAYADPSGLRALLERVTDVSIAYLGGQVRAGVDALQIFDSWAGALAPRDYMELAWPPLARLARAALGLGVPVIVFPRGNGGLLRRLAPELRQLTAAGDLVVGLDWTVDLDDAISVLGPEIVVQGNLDPTVLFAPPEVLDKRARELVTVGRRARGHVFNLGHGISQHVEPEQVARLVAAVHSA